MAGSIPTVYRGGPGISLSADPAEVARFGGAHEVVSIPAGLQLRQRGKRATHFELTPSEAMTMKRYRELLGQVVLKSQSKK